MCGKLFLINSEERYLKWKKIVGIAENLDS